MSLRSVFSRRTSADALRRMKAVLGVLDDDLASLSTALVSPVPTRKLSDAEWEAAEAARVAVERSLRELTAEAAVVATQASDWQAKVVLATQRGDSAAAAQARVRAEEAAQVVREYAQEINSIRAFLQEWAVRVTRAGSED